MPGSIRQNKRNLYVSLFLSQYKPDLDIIIASEASFYSIGACILHKLQGGSDKPIPHESRKLRSADKELVSNRGVVKDYFRGNELSPVHWR